MNSRDIFISLCVLFLVGGPSVGIAEEVTLADDNIPYLYESRSKIPAPDSKLAEIISVEYREARDEFTKRDLMKKIKHVLEEKFAQARATAEVVVRVNTNIGEYDFDKQAFPTGFTETTYIPFNNRYTAVFVNSEDLEFMPVPEEKARTWASVLGTNRQVTMVVKAKIVGTKEKQLDVFHDKVLTLQVTEFKLVQGMFRFGSKSM